MLSSSVFALRNPIDPGLGSYRRCVDGEFQAAEDVVEEEAVFHAVAATTAGVDHHLVVSSTRYDEWCVGGGVMDC